MTFKLLVLVRHADAEKNALGQFAGNTETDRLTVSGEAQLHQLITEIKLLIAELGITSVGIAHADSGRAKATALALSRLSSESPIAVSGFRSIRSGVAAGLTEIEIVEQHPDFANALQLYREGVVSSYDIPYPGEAEVVTDFEREVTNTLQDILNTRNNELQIIVGHRSSITAILIHYARIAHSYPAQFFGFIPLNACVTSCIDITAGSERILWVNRAITANSIAATAQRRH